ncbi:MAG TPA: DMT family transporter [Pyrinomonadaceae bacterium]|nr:DMT family transporter [Pyrinomonadaceae bacterium]
MKTGAYGRRGGAAPHLALIIVQIVFGTWPIVGKIALRALPSTGLVAFRVGGAAIAFLLLRTIVGRVEIESRRDYFLIALYSLLGVVLNQFLFVKGLSLSTVINSTLIGTTIPAFALLISIALGFDSMSWRKALGIALAACGVIYLVDPLRADYSGGHTVGNLLLLANSVAYGAYIAISKDLVKKYGALTVITWIFVFGTLVTIPVGGYEMTQTSLQNATMQTWIAVAYIILAPTVGCYYLNAWALARVEPSTVAVYVYLQPLIAFALAPWILQETWNRRTWVATLLIFAGVALVISRTKSKAIEEMSEHPEAMSH